MERIRITHFSDALCVWAYVSQIRIDELVNRFPGEIELDYRYFHVFGSVAKKMQTGWKDRGGLRGYSEHVRDVVDQFGHVALHPQAWLSNPPKSSMPAHIVLCAVRALEETGQVERATLPRIAWSLRTAFFRDARDISNMDVLLAIADEQALPMPALEQTLRSGLAHAALGEDLDMARAQAVQASPTLLFNEGRQRLTGNVGYRIMEANIRELVEAAPGQLSWC